MVTQFASYRNLRNLIDHSKNLSLEEIMNYLIMILIGLNYLHTNDIAHRDMNPRKILVDLI